MNLRIAQTHCFKLLFAALVVVFFLPPQFPPLPSASTSSDPFLVQAADLETAVRAVRAVEGTITHELTVINSVATRLNAHQIKALRGEASVLRIYEDGLVEWAGQRDSAPFLTEPFFTEFPRRVDADQLHKRNQRGQGVSLAVIDTGFFAHPGLLEDSRGNSRVLSQYDAIRNQEISVFETSDASGHGSHVTGISVNSSLSGHKRYNGMAPDADLVVVKAFNADGQATYADVIRGLDWVIANRAAYDIRVLNLSFSAPPRSFYWDDPLNQAVMAAWQAGIVVVVAAGNGGPNPMTIGVPGNVPYVITVGAMTDAYTPEEGSDDRLASFSATGPTVEGFIKPEIVAPGGHIESLMPINSQLAQSFPEFHNGDDYFVMSGTSQATAVVSGAALLMLSKRPRLTPDEVKCRLMASAQSAIDGSGQVAYSPLQQGAGLVNAYDATKSKEENCANRGLDLDLDLAGIEHYAGPVRLSEDGSTFYIEGAGYGWTGSYVPEEALWVGGNPWIDASLWQSGNPWIDASAWSTGNPWIDASGNPWIDASWWTASPDDDTRFPERDLWINPWVEQE